MTRQEAPDIAICGMSLRLGGGIRTPEEFWSVLSQGRDVQEPVPPDRYNIHGFTDRLGGKNCVKALNGYFINTAELGKLDVSHFQMSKDELAKCDPQQRLLLETTYEALADAGELEYAGAAIGCYVGTSAEDWLRMSAKELQHTQGNVLGGAADFMLPNRVSYQFNLKGPSYAIKTGCSASLLALHAACNDLRNGSTTGAVVGGTSLLLDPTMTALMSSDGIISPTGSCNTFDAKADGFARADGIAVLYIKRVNDAVRDGNPIRAVIKGTGTNTDGRNLDAVAGLMQPNGEAQEALMRQTYSDAGLDPHETRFVELHGTGTPVGDPIEATAVGRVFGSGNVNEVYIGSVKPNVGHTEAASGLVSTIKAVMALEKDLVPPNIKFTDPNPNIPFAKFGLRVPTKETPFPGGRAKRVSVNSFGVGGANAHVILEATRRQEPLLKHTGPHILLYSANTLLSLQRNKQQYDSFVQESPVPIADIAYTLGRCREKMPFRAFRVVDDTGEMLVESFNNSKAPSEGPKVVMIFTGQGAQWPRMGVELIETDPRFRADLERMDCILQTLQHAPAWDVISELQRPPESSRVGNALLSQPLCTILQIALFNHFTRAGIRPCAVIGHSSGEIAAAYAAHKLSLEAAIVLAYYRGLTVANAAELASSPGSMAVVSLGSRQLSPYLRTGVVIACENSPASSTISGDKQQVDEAIHLVKKDRPDADCRFLRVDTAYHSHHMLAPGRKYVRVVQQEMIDRNWGPGKSALSCAPNTRFFSSVTGEHCEASALQDPAYWQKNLVSPVRFATAVANLLKDPELEECLFLEIGPHAALAGPLRQNCVAAGQRCEFVPSLTRGKDSRVSLHSAIGELFLRGVSLDLSFVFPTGKAIGGLPPYAWDHSNTYWYESRLSREWRFRKHPHHCLLGSRLVESSDLEPIWRNMIHIENEPWLSDHRVKDDVVFPLVGYVSMAGEAIRQLTGLDDGYTIKDLVVRTALVLPESSAVEVLTSLRQYKTSDIDYQSEWFTFSICSHNGSSWILHCEGLVKHCNEAERLNKIVCPREHQRLPRTVNESQFYKALSRAGITYGPEFLLLRDVRSATTHCEATGELVRKPNESYNHFVQHPVLMDACFQLVFVSLAQGLGRNLDRTLMPTKIQELYVRRFPEDTSNGPARVASWGSETDASVECMIGNSVVFYIGGAQFSQLGEGILGPDEPDDDIVDPHAAARLYWLPDAECFDVGSLIQPPRKYERKEVLMLEELTLLCILESADRIRLLEPQMGFMVKYREWLLRDIAAAKRGEHPFLKNAVTLATMSPAERRRLLDNVYSCLLKSERTSLPIAVKRICDNIEDITSGKGQVLDVLMHDNELTKLYSHLSFDYGNFVKVVSHWRPTLRILEVGAGTGATTELIVRSLLGSRQTKAGLPSYSTYTFTDISAGFFAQAKERFSYAPNMEYKVLDVSRDALSQGFEPASYDIVFAANVLHATPSLANTLTNLRTVLKPGGYIVITELCCLKRCAGYIFGTLPGWWLGQEDGREWEPYVPVSRWNEELKGAGFTGVDTAVYDDEQPFHFSAAIVSRRLDPTPSGVTTRGPVAILSEVPDSALTQNLVEFLRTMGWETMVASTESAGTLRGDADIICLWDLEAEFFENMTEHSFNQYKQLIKTMKPRQNLLWTARPVQIGCLDPRSAQGIGAAKAVRAELGLNVCTLEIEPSQECFSEIVEKVFRRIRRDSEEENEKLYADKEFAVIDGVVCTGRYHPFSVNDELAEVTNSASAAGYAQPWDLDDKLLTRKRLDMERPGRLETLRWVQEPIDRALDDNAVEVEPRYVGLNFRDVVIANGLLSLPEESPSLSGFGVECAGVVTRTGQAVRGLSVGDRVMALTAGGCLSTRVVIPALQVCKIPDAVSFEEAATIPACFGTAWKAICDVACVEKGQSVLIHSACGGFGLAAVQICRLFDAEIFATVSSPEKIDHLVHDCGIPRNHIFDSRSNSFLGGVMRETEGRGVDLVLNSLSGDLLHASWKCVAPFGMLVELGKRDIAASGKLDMLPFLQNRSYSCINMAQIVRERPETIQRILCRLVSLFENGKLTPLAPKQVFSPLEMHRVFLHFQQGIHIGKLLIRLEPEDMGFKAAPTYRPVRFKPDAAYLLVGGLGGLGRSIATWLAERGARHLVFLSRCAGLTDVSKQAVRELASMGCHAVTVAGRVDKVEDVKRAIGSAEAPIRGVFQLAMVLKDASMTEMSWSDWHAVVAPKVQGTYNLHNELLHEPLDFFWMASSLVSVIDQTGQGNYGAANTFLEAFSQYRRTLGLPASVLNISPIDGVGYIAENPHARRSVAFQDMGFETEKAFLDTLELSILRSRVDEDESPRLAITANPPKPWADRSQIIMGLRSTVNLNDEAARTNWRFNRRMGFYHNTRPNDNTNDEACLEAGADQTLKNLLSRASRDVSVLDDDLELGFLARHISRKVLDMTLKPADTPVDVSKSTLGQMGVDSLIAVELRRWFRSAYGLHFSALEVMQAGTFMQVGKTVAEKLKEKYSSIPN
ncbi:Lovastatin diketide synthase LovF 14 [Colletotrichum truncatum]|uniref:Lovastatin diketide synthase LovF 14 n=1 Tax=Colletotrichum truncatum TaxID=5467 RepID=A0ACC3Z8Z5_COLTU|nr:Lovastatin diketide synthase LovF 14 [Colletotrichum truncatum]KAF6780557.1 Lovastatin diketide synthase LovF 14 [Colletotrichum truncatum]